jgi:hypothetical protein
MGGMQAAAAENHISTVIASPLSADGTVPTWRFPFEKTMRE